MFITERYSLCYDNFFAKGGFMDATMVAEASSIASNLSYAVPTSITCGLFACFLLYMKVMERRHDKDREEHVIKWNTMAEQQKTATDAQSDRIKALIASHENQLSGIMKTHQAEMDRQFKLHERTASAVEALTHNISTLAKELK